MKTIKIVVWFLMLISFNANSQCSVTINPQSPTTFCDDDSVVLIASGTGGGGSMVPDQSQLVYNGGTSARNLPGYSHWQSFTAGITGTLSQLDLGFFTYINGTGTLNIFSGTGTGGALLQTQTVSVFCSGGNCTLSFAVSAAVISGQVYTYQFIPGPGIPDPYGVQVEVPGTYPGGEMALVDPSGTYLTGFDMVFQTYVIGGNGLSYLWSDGSIDTVIVATTSGTYTVTVSNGSGCTAIDSVQVSVLPAPAINVGNDTTICAGSSLLLDAGNGFSNYLWNDGTTNSTLNADTAGIYFVEVTNGVGCSSIDSIVISNTNCAPVIAFYSSDSAFCEKKCIDFFDLSTNNPTSWLWLFPGADSTTSTLQNPTNICYNSYGNFDVTLIACNAFSCDTLILTNFINEYQTPSDSIYQSNDTLYSMPGYTYQWYEVTSGFIAGATNQYFYPLAAGSYYCVATNAIGCFSTSNVISITSINQITAGREAGSIVPNPFKDALTVTLNNNQSLIITIHDITSRKLMQQTFINSTFINTQILTKGIYIYEVSNMNGVIKKGKVVKE